jgi:predicted PolB exonuclease-like 3'-5' exonuclease
LKILLLDIESSPNVAHVWGIWQQNVGINQLMESSYVLCWAAKWLGEEEVMFDSVHVSKPKKMLKKIHDLISEADAVIHYNGTKFDMPTLNKEFLLHDMNPPAPYKQIDLLKQVRSQFRFPSNKLDYVAQRLGLGSKTSHEGHELWVKCMAGDKDAWKRMEEYNIQDVVLLEKLYGLKTTLTATIILIRLFVLVVVVRICRREVSLSLLRRLIKDTNAVLVDRGVREQNKLNRQ